MLTWGQSELLPPRKAAKRSSLRSSRFLARPIVRDLHMALGQFFFYRYLLRDWEPARVLWLALPEEAFVSILGDVAGLDLIEALEVRLFTVDPLSEEIVRWLK